MAARKTLRLVSLLVWLVLALITVGTTLAQDGEGVPAGEVRVESSAAAPDDLDSVAARLAPLLVGAALIERTLEFLFNWVERAVLDAGHYLHKAAASATGLVHIGLRDAWGELNELTTVVLRRQGMPHSGDHSADEVAAQVEDWPLAAVERRLQELEEQVNTAEKSIRDAMRSDVYIARKKVTAAWLSIGFGLFLAVVTDMRLFRPLGVQVMGSYDGAFQTVDLVLAGILMGLGTDWVHQVISVLTKGQRALGRAGEGPRYNPEEVERVASAAVEAELTARFRELLGQAEQELEDHLNRFTGRDDSPA